MIKRKFQLVKSLAEFKRRSRKEGGIDVFITLKYGLRSTKHISFDGVYFWISNLIDSSEQKLTEGQLMGRGWTNIGYALEHKALIYN